MKIGDSFRYTIVNINLFDIFYNSIDHDTRLIISSSADKVNKAIKVNIYNKIKSNPYLK